MIKLNVYRLRDSSLGFYHTGLEYDNREYTYCCGIGICYHKPKRCHFAVLLGTKPLGYVDIDSESFQTILKGKYIRVTLKIKDPVGIKNDITRFP